MLRDHGVCIYKCRNSDREFGEQRVGKSRVGKGMFSLLFLITFWLWHYFLVMTHHSMTTNAKILVHVGVCPFHFFLEYSYIIKNFNTENLFSELHLREHFLLYLVFLHKCFSNYLQQRTKFLVFKKFLVYWKSIL